MSSPMEYQLRHVWSIKKETFMNIPSFNGIKSQNFKTTFPDVEYFLQCRSTMFKTTIFINVGPSATIKEMKLIIPSANYESNFSAPSFDWLSGSECVEKTIKREDLLNPESNCFVDGILKMEFRGIIQFKETSFDLGKILWKREDKGFTFIVGDKRIKIHKFILNQFSSVVHNLSNANEIEISNFGYKVVHIIVDLCYGIDELLNENLYRINHLFELINFTNVYDMPLIKEKIELDLEKFIKNETVCEMANKSIEYKCNKLRGYCVNFIAKCFANGKQPKGIVDLELKILDEANVLSFGQIPTITNRPVFNFGKLLLRSNEFVTDGAYKDCVFVVGNQRFVIHRLLVRQFSSVFTEMLKKPKSSTIGLHELKTKNVDELVVKDIVALCYGQKDWCFSKQEAHFFKLIEFTNVYDMPLIKEQIENHLTQYINNKNICSLANKSIEYKCDKLRAFCINFISNCIKNGKKIENINGIPSEIVGDAYKGTICQTQLS